MGKTSLLKELFARDTATGICVFDTEGTLDIPHDVLFDPASTKWNPLAEPIDPDLAPNFFAQTVKDAYGYDDLTTPVMSMYLAFLAAALMENRYNLTDAPKFLTDKSFREKCQYKNDLVDQFWRAFEKLSDKDKRQEIASTLNKFLALLLDERVNRMLSVNRARFSLKDAKDQIMLVRLPVSEYGKETVSLVGSLVLSYLYQMIDDNYSIYIEDAHLFARGTLKEILSRGGVGLTLSHQFIDQIDPAVFAAIQGNCEEQFVFRVSQKDADVLSRDLPPMSSKASLDALPNFTYRRLPYDKSPDRVTVPLEM